MLREDRADQLVAWRIGCLPGGSAGVREPPAVSPAYERAVSAAVVSDWLNDVINDTPSPSPGGVYDPGKESGDFKPRASRRTARGPRPSEAGTQTRWGSLTSCLLKHREEMGVLV